MSNGEEMINKFTLKEINRIINLCEPLYRLGITFFYYTHTTANGMCFSIGNMPEVQEEYYRSKLYKISPFFHNSSLIQPGLYSYRCISNPEFQKSMDTLSNAIGLELGVCLVV